MQWPWLRILLGYWIVGSSVSATTAIHDYDVIIVGGGLAGLSAAQRLHTTRTTRTLVLEAASYWGGRTRTVSMNTTSIDMGGMYWHGSDQPVLQSILADHCYPLVETLASQGDSVFPGYPLFFHNLQPVPDLQKRLETLYARWMETYSAQNYTLNEDKRGFSNEEQTLLRLAQFFTFELDLLGTTYKAVQREGWKTQWDWKSYNGSDIVFRHGLQKSWIESLVSRLSRSSATDMRLQERVEHIRASPDACTVQTSTAHSQYVGRYCIVTLPLGVLKAHHWTLFEPALPPEKRSALERTELSTLNTVVFQWDKPVCRISNYTSYYFVSDDGANDSPLSRGFVCTGLLRHNNDPTITQFHFVDDREYDFDDRQFWIDAAKKVVQPLVDEPLEVLDVRLSLWHKDPNILGSYSVPSRRTNGNVDRKTLADSFLSLFFAGEHTHFQGRYQSMDGAFETGTRAATQVLHRLATTPVASSR